MHFSQGAGWPILCAFCKGWAFPDCPISQKLRVLPVAQEEGFYTPSPHRRGEKTVRDVPGLKCQVCPRPFRYPSFDLTTQNRTPGAAISSRFISIRNPQIERASPGRVEIKIPALSLPKARDKDGAPAGHWTSSLQRVARRSRGWISADVVAFEFAVEGGAADAEHAAGEGFVAFHLLEDPLDGGTLDIFQIGS